MHTHTDTHTTTTIKHIKAWADLDFIASFARPAKAGRAALKEARSMVENRSNQIQYDFYL